jgi:xanthine dehydrogenase YagS FAD-binding subunit
MAVALAILDATVHVQGPTEARSIPISDFFRLPGESPEVDNTMLPAELIVGIELPPSDFADHSWYLKVRDRHSYAFALVSAAAGLQLDNGTIRSAALALGGVAAKPWRARDAEQSLIGKAPGPKAFHAAAQLALDGAEALSQNGFKIDLGCHSVVRSLTRATEDRQSR